MSKRYYYFYIEAGVSHDTTDRFLVRVKEGVIDFEEHIRKLVKKVLDVEDIKIRKATIDEVASGLFWEHEIADLPSSRIKEEEKEKSFEECIKD